MSRVGIFGQISEINDHLFLSGAGCIKPDKIKQKRITCIVNATTEEPSANLPGVDYLRIRIDDNAYARLDSYFDVVADRIRSIRDRGGRTLVHCVAGVSRSASLVMVYLMKYERMTLRHAYNYVKARRPVIRPNVGFWKQMCDYEKRIRGTNSVQMLMTPQCDLAIPDMYCEDLKISLSRESSALSKSVHPASTTTLLPKRRGYSAGTRGSSLPRRTTSPALTTSLLPFSSKYSLLSPAPTRKPRDSLFSIYSSSPRNKFFSAF